MSSIFVKTPSYSLFDFSFCIVTFLASFTLMLFYLTISALLLQFRITMIALYFFSSIGAFSLPALDQTEDAKRFILRQVIHHTSALWATIFGFFFAFDSLVNKLFSRWRRWDICLYFFVLSERCGNERPFSVL